MTDKSTLLGKHQDVIHTLLNTPLPLIIRYGICWVSFIIVILFVLCFYINLEENVHGYLQVCKNGNNNSSGNYVCFSFISGSNLQIPVGQEIQVDIKNYCCTGTIISCKNEENDGKYNIEVAIHTVHELNIIDNEFITVTLKYNFGDIILSSLKIHLSVNHPRQMP
jgi:hypothetical protein